jgi:hypothetical protein
LGPESAKREEQPARPERYQMDQNWALARAAQQQAGCLHLRALAPWQAEQRDQLLEQQATAARPV